MSEKTDNNFWVVVNSRLPTTITFKHDSEDSARKEAKRLARYNPGCQFVVMQSVVGYKIDDLAEAKYVDPSTNPDDDRYIPF